MVENTDVGGGGGGEDEVLNLEDLPQPDSPGAVKEAANKIKAVIKCLNDDGIDPDTLLSNLEYISEVIGVVATKTDEGADDDLSELTSEAVPDEVRKWLASTFAKQDQVSKRSDEVPSFRSVANAIRTGLFIEKIYKRMAGSQLIVIPDQVQACLDEADNWTFDSFSLSVAAGGSPLKYIGYELLQRHGCLHKYKIPPSLLDNVLQHIESGYAQNCNPYHNNMHACDVLQTAHWFLSQTGISKWLSDLEVFALLFSAIIHDLNHTGTTNNFHVNSGSTLALLYNDRAVLENHHVAAFFKIMADNDLHILNNMSKPDFREFRSLMIEMVLHTDMTTHFSLLKSMKATLQAYNEGGSKFGNKIRSEGGPSFEKTKVLCLILHTCDISHPSKQWELHHKWTARCMEEFFKQGDMENSMGLDYSPLCDRHNTVVPQSQIGFIDFIVNPTMQVCGDTLFSIVDSMDAITGKETTMDRPWEANIEANRSKWKAKADSGEKGIEASDAVNDLKPPSPRIKSASSKSGRSRASSITPPDANEQTEPKENGVPESEPEETDEEKKAKLTTPALPPFIDNSHLIKQIGPIQIPSAAPVKPTKHKDVVKEIPPNVLSRPGSPLVWNFDAKESITTLPPRPQTGNIMSPPEKRRAPVSVDHTLRKHALDF